MKITICPTFLFFHQSPKRLQSKWVTYFKMTPSISPCLAMYEKSNKTKPYLETKFWKWISCWIFYLFAVIVIFSISLFLWIIWLLLSIHINFQPIPKVFKKDFMDLSLVSWLVVSYWCVSRQTCPTRVMQVTNFEVLQTFLLLRPPLTLFYLFLNCGVPSCNIYK